MPKKQVINTRKEALDIWMKDHPGILVSPKMAKDIIEEKTKSPSWFCDVEDIIFNLRHCSVGYYMEHDCLVFGKQDIVHNNIETVFDLLFEKLDKIEDRLSDLERCLNNESK